MAALAVVEDLDVLKERGAGLQMRAEGLPGKEFALQGGEEALGHCVIVTVADRPHRAADAHRLAALAEEQRGVLRAVIGVVNDTLTRFAVPDRHLQRPDDQRGAQVRRHRPAHDPAAEHVEDHRQIEKALVLCRHVGDVRDPEHIGRARRKRPLDEVGDWLGQWIAPRRLEGASAMAAHQTVPAHETGNALVPAPNASHHQFRMDTWDTIRATTRLMNRHNLLAECRISLRPR